MPDEKCPAESGAMERAYCAIEATVLRLHRGQPLFSPLAEMQDWNKLYRRELIQALIQALDLLRQNGVSAEQTVLLEKVRRAYTSAQ